MIMFGTGSRSGHTVMALRFDGELYIVESQDAWYWPIKGIQRNRFSEWMKYAETAEFNVVHMPLSDENRLVFNETAALEFFYQTQGLPYGFHNFLSSWFDTPYHNLPIYLPSDLVPIVFSALEDFLPDVIDIFWT